MADSSRVSSSLKSGLTGGAATGLGVDYQTLYTTYLALKLIAQLLCESPTQRPLISIEPRLVSNDSETPASVTRWDIQVSPNNLAVEVKAKANKNDLFGLLDRCRKSVELNQNQSFELVYGECSVNVLKAIEKLLRLATEAGGDSARFDSLCNLESDTDLKNVLAILGIQGFTVASRLTVKHFPESPLQDAIKLHLQFLVPSSQQQSLLNELYQQFSRAMRERKPFFIPELIRNLKKLGYKFTDPDSILPLDIEPNFHKSIFFLQRCDVSVPIKVLTDLTGSKAAELEQQFNTTQAAALDANGCWQSSPLPAKLDHSEAKSVLASGLKIVLEYIKANKSNVGGLRQVENAVALVRVCSTCSPNAATTAFDPLDKLLKRSGQKQLVLEIARLTVESARRVSPPTEAVRKAEAKALICGYAWVYQRIGQFDEAELAANESLEIGSDLDWDRNTAFCQKCLGRLYRVRAEQETNAKKKTKLLIQSRDKLLEAIGTFSASKEFGPEHEEVGDCYSLLARTHLLSNRPKDADECATKARALLISKFGFENSKDYMDLLILEGELHAKHLSFPAADKKFQEALECSDPHNAEKSEIAARAHFARGQTQIQWKQDKNTAAEEFEKARQIWENLDERFYKALAEWTIIETRELVSRRDRLRLRKEQPTVRLEMVRLLQSATLPTSSRTLSQRNQLNDSAWKDLVKQAKKNDAVANRRW